MSKKQNNRKYNGKKDYRKDKKGDPRDKRDLDSKNKEDRAKRNDGSSKYSDKNGEYVSSFSGTENDPSWYNRNKQLLNDVSKISFYTQTGKSYNFDEKYAKDLNVPTTMVFETVPTPGFSDDSVSGVSLAAQGVFSYMRKNLSTVANYSSADVGMYIMAIDNIYAYYSHLMRLFGIANIYSSDNMTFPTSLFCSLMGFRGQSSADRATYMSVWKDFIGNLNNYRSRFNNLIYKASALYLPTDFTIVARHSWLYGSIFFDSRSRKAQMYAHIPRGTYVLNETKYDTGTALEWVDKWEDDKPSDYASYIDMLDMDRMLNRFDWMIERVRNSDSMLRIAADMRRAFEDRQFWKLAYCDEGYVCNITHSDEVLSQINNIGFVDWWDSAYFVANGVDSRDVTQNVDDNTIIFDPFIFTDSPDIPRDYADYISQRKVILNAHWDDPTVDDIAVMTRNIPTFGISTAPLNHSALHIYGMGADIITSAILYAGIVSKYNWTVVQMTGDNVADFNLLTAWTSFDWAPALNINAQDPQAPSQTHPLQEWDNYVPVDPEVIRRIHDNIIISMWSIPQLGMFDA